jgi:hypothetical protein
MELGKNYPSGFGRPDIFGTLYIESKGTPSGHAGGRGRHPLALSPRAAAVFIDRAQKRPRKKKIKKKISNWENPEQGARA